MSQPDPAVEMLPVVDGDDRVVGTAPRSEVHAQGLLHRAVHVLLFNSAGQVYLQRRSLNKDTHPLKWAASASGHVDPGEDYQPAAARELAEELGVRPKLSFVGSIAACEATENEFTYVYQARADRPPRPNGEEIIEGRFFNWGQALALAGDPVRATPSLAPVLGLLPIHKPEVDR